VILDAGSMLSPGQVALQINDTQGVDLSTVMVSSPITSLNISPSISSLGPLTAAPALPDDPNLPNLVFRNTSTATVTADAVPIELFTFSFETFGVPAAPGFYIAAETTDILTHQSVTSFGFAIATAVPEPSLMVLLLTGLPVVALWVGVRRRSAGAA
jgi:hypothetical protein